MRKGLSVGPDDVRDGVDLATTLHVPIDWEAVADLSRVNMSRNATETEERELLVGVIRLDDSSDIVDGSLVLIVPPQVV